MELPSDPKNLLYGVYGKDGVNLTPEEEELEADKQAVNWALSDPEPEYKAMDETPYDIVSYTMWG